MGLQILFLYASLPGLSTLAKELTAVTHEMQSSSYELSPLVSGKAKYKQVKAALSSGRIWHKVNF